YAAERIPRAGSVRSEERRKTRPRWDAKVLQEIGGLGEQHVKPRAAHAHAHCRDSRIMRARIGAARQSRDPAWGYKGALMSARAPVATSAGKSRPESAHFV